MNKNTVIALLLIAAILVGFSIYTSHEQKKEQEARQKELRIQDSIQRANYVPDTTVRNTAPAAAFTTSQPAIDSSYGASLMTAAKGEQQLYTLENNLLKVTFTNKGARIYSAQVKKFKTADSLPVILFDGDENNFSLDFFAHKKVSTSSFFFTPVQTPTTTLLSETDSVATLTYRLQTAANAHIDFVYTLRNNSYLVDLSVQMQGMDAVIPQNVTTVDLTWTADVLRQEKDFTSEANYSTVSYKFPSTSSIEELSERKEAADEKITTAVEWVAFKQQFFSSILVANPKFENATVAYQNSTAGNAGDKLMHCSAVMQLAYKSEQETTIPLQFYFGPNHYNTLKSYDHSFDKLVPMGGWFIGSINRWLIVPVFNFLSQFISNYGVIILLLTIFIKIILAPFSQKSVLSSAKMKLLQPEIQKINEKYPKTEDAMKKQQEIMALYKKTGVSMMGGCLPMLLQMPILFAMFKFFPASFELRQESFLWAQDLSRYDSILNLPFSIPMYGNHISLFALLMAVSTFFYSKMMMSQTPQVTSQPGMKFMQLYFMPVFLLVLCNNFSAGLSYYYMLSNVITMLQTWILRKFFVNEEKLHAKMKARAAAAPTKKKSRFQQMLEDAQKAQQQKAKRK